MEITNKVKSRIEEMYKDSNYNVRSISLGYKKVNGERTDDIAIIVRVVKKKPISELEPEELIPPTMVIDGQEIKTDVIEDPSEIKALACFADTDADVLKLRGDPALITPLWGGQEITQFPTGWEDVGGGSYSFTVGTLGFIGVDDIDSRVVGVTNAHVVLKNADINNDRDVGTELSSPYNIIEPIEWVVDTNSYAPGALLRDESAPGTFVDGASNIKRYIPYDVDGTNYVDVALIIMDPTKIDNTSYHIHQPTGEVAYNDYMPFATTAEIDSLLATPRTIYSTGRTTGPKGWGVSPSCTLEVTGLAESITVSGLSEGTNLSFSDVVRFEFSDGSNYPIDSGDSGSAVVADFDGTRKIVGIAFAGGLTAGFFCRIDRVAEAIKIRAWDTHYVYDASVPTANITMAPVEDSSSSSVTVTPECKYLFQAGTSLVDTHTDLLSITPLVCSVTPTFTPTVTPTSTVTPTVTPTITPTPSGGSSTLTNDLIAWWGMGEVSGDRINSHSTGASYDLTASGTLNQVAGVVGNATEKVSSGSGQLTATIGDAPLLYPIDSDFTIAGWVNVNVWNNFGIFSVFDFTNGYSFQATGAWNGFTWDVKGSQTSDFQSYSTDTWYHFVCYHDSVNDQIGIIINDGTPSTTAHSTGIDAPSSSFDLEIFTLFGGGGQTHRLDEVGVWNRMLTGAEISELYNGGSGIGYP